MSKIILHSCCGPCASSSIEQLIKQENEPIIFFSNSNIDSLEEFNKRFSQMKIVAKYFKTPLFLDEYNHNDWLKSIKGFENSPEGGERCKLCFKFNLERTSQFLQNQYPQSKKDIKFTTTLTVSPHKHSETIFDIGKSFDEFEPFNFKKKGGFQRSNEISRELNLYRQKYCGCEFSKRTKLQNKKN